MSTWRQHCEWSDAGNPILACYFCGKTHEWTVRSDEGWGCAEAARFHELLDSVIVEDLERAYGPKTNRGVAG